MNYEVIVTCAVTGAGDTVGKHPAIPVTPKEIAAAAIEAAKAGATVAHCHVRDPQTGKPSRDVALYRELERELIKRDDAALISRVDQLRNLLNDSRDHDILMTIPRRGYRFNPLYVRNAANAETAPTAIEPEPLTAPVAAPIKQPPNWLRLGYAFTLLMCLATLAHFSLSAKPPGIEVASYQRGNLTLSTLGYSQDQARALGTAVDKQLHNLPKDLAGQVWIHQSKSNYSISCIRTDQTTRNLLFNPQQRQLADVLAQCLEVSL